MKFNVDAIAYVTLSFAVATKKCTTSYNKTCIISAAVYVSLHRYTRNVQREAGHLSPK